MDAIEKQMIEEATGEGLIDAGRVIILVGNPATKTAIPMPIPAVFEQLFGILGDLDRRLTALEGTSRIIVP